MFNTIVEAAKNFCLHQIGFECALQDGVAKNRTLIAYIDINTENGNKFRVYVAPEEGFAQKISQVFLEEDQSDEETLRDMTLETANLIVGSAKVIYEENHNPFTIETPFLEKIDLFDCEYDQFATLDIENNMLTLAIKEIH